MKQTVTVLYLCCMALTSVSSLSTLVIFNTLHQISETVLFLYKPHALQIPGYDRFTLIHTAKQLRAFSMEHEQRLLSSGMISISKHRSYLSW